MKNQNSIKQKPSSNEKIKSRKGWVRRFFWGRDCRTACVDGQQTYYVHHWLIGDHHVQPPRNC